MYGNLTLILMYVSGGLVVFLIMFFIMIVRENNQIRKLKQKSKEMDEERDKIIRSTEAHALKLLEEKDRLIHMTWYYTFVIRKTIELNGIEPPMWSLKDLEYLQQTEFIPYHEEYDTFQKWMEDNMRVANQAKNN